MARFAYRRGLHDLGGGCFAFLQPDGSWGWSNAGLVTGGDVSLLIDTLFDVPKTREMLAAMRDASPAAQEINALVNTHANGDHCYGNAAAAARELIASEDTAAEMRELPPRKMRAFMRLARVLSALPGPLGRVPLGTGASLGQLGRYFLDCFGDFEFGGDDLPAPTCVFRGELHWRVGDTMVALYQVGPAHTRGDAIVHVPSARVVFTGDILFHRGHPILWEGPVDNWIDACDRIVALDPEVVVPGHGPITDVGAVVALKRYLETLRDEVRQRFAAGMEVMEAARDIRLDDYADWGDPERMAINVDTIYRELRGGGRVTPPIVHFARMAALAGPR